jgi:hypothetical protein
MFACGCLTTLSVSQAKLCRMLGITVRQEFSQLGRELLLSD